MTDTTVQLKHAQKAYMEEHKNLLTKKDTDALGDTIKLVNVRKHLLGFTEAYHSGESEFEQIKGLHQKIYAATSGARINPEDSEVFKTKKTVLHAVRGGCFLCADPDISEYLVSLGYNEQELENKNVFALYTSLIERAVTSWLYPVHASFDYTMHAQEDE